jgi:hypothetical protein
LPLQVGILRLGRGIPSPLRKKRSQVILEYVVTAQEPVKHRNPGHAGDNKLRRGIDLYGQVDFEKREDVAKRFCALRRRSSLKTTLIRWEGNSAK